MMARVTRMTKRRLGELLQVEGLITEEQLRAAFNEQRQSNLFLSEALVKLGYITEEAIAQTIVQQFSLPFMSAQQYAVSPDVLRTFPEQMYYEYQFIAVDKIGQVMVIIGASLMNHDVLDELERISGCQVRQYVSTWQDIRMVLERHAKELHREQTSLSDLGTLLLDSSLAPAAKTPPPPAPVAATASTSTPAPAQPSAEPAPAKVRASTSRHNMPAITRMTAQLSPGLVMMGAAPATSASTSVAPPAAVAPRPVSGIRESRRIAAPTAASASTAASGPEPSLPPRIVITPGLTTPFNSAQAPVMKAAQTPANNPTPAKATGSDPATKAANPPGAAQPIKKAAPSTPLPRLSALTGTRPPGKTKIAGVGPNPEAQSGVNPPQNPPLPGKTGLLDLFKKPQ